MRCYSYSASLYTHDAQSSYASVGREAEDNYPLEEDTGLAEPCMLSADISLEDQLANIGVSFHDKLFELIDEAHLDNKDV